MIGLTKEFYQTFWEEIKIFLCNSITKSYQNGELSTSQRQAVIKLTEQNDKDKKLIKNWRPIYLLNIDTKLISKVLAERLKKVLPYLVSTNQTEGRLISDILEISDNLKIKGFLMALDIGKAFDSVNHLFLIRALEKYGFKEDFIKWIQILIQNQESCVINGVTTTNYFYFERGTKQGDPISIYLFILVSEIALLFIMQNKISMDLIFLKIHFFIRRMQTILHFFFLKYEKSVTELIKTIDIFSTFSGLKPNKSICEIASLGTLEGVKLALCGTECIDLMFNAIKILGVYYSYDENFENQGNFINLVLKIEKLLRLLRMRNLSIAGKITIFKTLAISKIVHLALVKVIPNSVILELDNINKHFIWKNGNPKIKQDTLCKDYENGGLKNVDITFKIISLQCSWVKRFYDNSIYDWKLIPFISF